MKCPVCNTTIPLGKHECPHCGYEAKKTDPQQERSKDYSLKKKQNLKVALVVVVALIAFGLLLTLQTHRLQTLRLPSMTETYEKSFEELIEDGVDQNHTLVDIVRYRDDLKSFLEKNGYSEFNEKEITRKKFDILFATYRVNCLKGDTHYSAEVTFSSEDSLTSTTIQVLYSHNQSIRANSLPFPKEDLNVIAKYLNIPDAYEVFDKGRLNMFKEESLNKYKYFDHDDYRDVQLYEQNNKEGIYSVRFVYEMQQ